MARDEAERSGITTGTTSSEPNRILAALQIYLRGGRLPEPENDGRHYRRLPVNRF